MVDGALELGLQDALDVAHDLLGGASGAREHVDLADLVTVGLDADALDVLEELHHAFIDSRRTPETQRQTGMGGRRV
jgi:hypothetical protein